MNIEPHVPQSHPTDRLCFVRDRALRDLIDDIEAAIDAVAALANRGEDPPAQEGEPICAALAEVINFLRDLRDRSDGRRA